MVDRDLIHSGVVTGETHYENFTRLFVRIDRVVLAGDTVTHLVPAQYYVYEHGIFLGKRIFVKGHMKQARRIYQPSVLTGKIVGRSIPQQLFGKVFHPLRNRIDDMLRQAFSQDHYPIASGLILGGSGRMGKELKDVFGRAGVLHILAVSGLHVGFVVLFLGLVFFVFPFDYRLRFIVIMLGLFVYAGVTGFRPSICRAVTMAFLLGLASVLQRNVDHIHVLNITALTFLIVQPALILDAGTQLSFAAVYGILLLYPRFDAVIKRKTRIRYVRFVLRPMAVSLSAQLFVAPLLVYYFHRLSLYAVLANLLVVPIAAVAILLLFFSFAAGFFWYGAVEYAALPVGLLINTLVAVSGFIAGLPFSTIRVMVSPLLVFPLYLAVWKKMRRLVLWVVFFAAGLSSIAGSANCLVVCNIDKGILVVTPSRETILICVKKSASQRIFLERAGINGVDYLVAPSEWYPVKREFIELPEKMYYKQFTLGDLEGRISKDIEFRFCDTRLTLARSEVQQAGEGVTYWLSNGRCHRMLSGLLYCTIFEQMILDAQMVFTRLSMLVY